MTGRRTIKWKNLESKRAGDIFKELKKSKLRMILPTTPLSSEYSHLFRKSTRKDALKIDLFSENWHQNHDY